MPKNWEIFYHLNFSFLRKMRLFARHPPLHLFPVVFFWFFPLLIISFYFCLLQFCLINGEYTTQHYNYIALVKFIKRISPSFLQNSHSRQSPSSSSLSLSLSFSFPFTGASVLLFLPHQQHLKTLSLPILLLVQIPNN